MINFSINNKIVLTETSLGTTVTDSSLTSVYKLDSGSITSGFGSIDVGDSTISTTGQGSFGELSISGNILPTNTNQNIGSSTNRWDTIYATNGTINTSDRNKKKNIVDSDLGMILLIH